MSWIIAALLAFPYYYGARPIVVADSADQEVYPGQVVSDAESWEALPAALGMKGLSRERESAAPPHPMEALAP